MRFNELVQIVKTDRNGQHAPKLEQKLLQELKDHQKRSFRGVEIITLLDTYFLVLRGVMSQQYFKRK